MLLSTSTLKDFKPDMRYHEYYFEDGNLHILVKDMHFLVHSYFFTRESKTFQERLCGPVATGEARKGSDSNVLILEEEDITAEQFATFLWVFYDRKFSRTAPEENWTVILHLAHRWAFPDVKSLAIDKLESIDMPPAKRISLYQKFEVPAEILIPHYVSLCIRPQILTVEETETLGGPTTIMIFAVRERLLSGLNGKNLDQVEEKNVHRLLTSYFESRKKQASNKNTTINGNDKK